MDTWIDNLYTREFHGEHESQVIPFQFDLEDLYATRRQSIYSAENKQRHCLFLLKWLMWHTIYIREYESFFVFTIEMCVCLADWLDAMWKESVRHLFVGIGTKWCLLRNYSF